MHTQHARLDLDQKLLASMKADWCADEAVAKEQDGMGRIHGVTWSIHHVHPIVSPCFSSDSA